MVNSHVQQVVHHLSLGKVSSVPVFHKVGLPGASEGMNVKDPTIAGLLKAQGYATGQFGKDHLGDQR